MAGIFTKCHYEAVAKILAHMGRRGDDFNVFGMQNDYLVATHETCDMFIALFKLDNNKFNLASFENAIANEYEKAR